MRVLGIFAALLITCLTARAQNCPLPQKEGFAEASEVSTLHGTLVFHDELRHWLGFTPDQPVCGQTEIQLVFKDAESFRRAKTFRGCAITVTGKLYDSPTGYYSTDVAISDAELKPDPACHPLPFEPDLTTAPVPSGLKGYRASITVDYRGKGHVDVQVWETSNKRMLQPWEAFVGYNITGSGDGIWFGCRDGFSVHTVTQTPKASDGTLTLDEKVSGTVLQNLEGINTVEFGCQKSTHKDSPTPATSGPLTKKDSLH